MHYDYYELQVLHVAEEGFFCDNDGNFLSFIPSPFTAKGMYHFTTVSSILYQIKVTFRFFLLFRNILSELLKLQVCRKSALL